MKNHVKRFRPMIPVLALLSFLIFWRISVYEREHVPLQTAIIPHPYTHIGQAAGAIAFSPDGRTLAVADTQTYLRFWDVHPFRLQQSFAHVIGDPYFVEWTPDQSAVLVADLGDLQVIDVKTGKVRRRLTMAPSDFFRGSNAEKLNYDAEYTASSSATLAAGGTKDGTLSVWEVGTGRRLFHVDAKPKVVNGQKNYLCSLIFSPDDRWLATAMLTGKESAWQSFTVQVIVRDAHTGHIDKKWNWEGTGLDDGPRYDYFGLLRYASLAFSSDGHVLAGISPYSGAIWNPNNSKMIRTFVPDPQAWYGSKELRFVPNQHLIVGIGWGDKINIWQTDTGKLIQTFYGTADTQAITVSPDGKRIISGGQEKDGNGSMQEWDLSNVK